MPAQRCLAQRSNSRPAKENNNTYLGTGIQSSSMRGTNVIISSVPRVFYSSAKSDASIVCLADNKSNRSRGSNSVVTPLASELSRIRQRTIARTKSAPPFRQRNARHNLPSPRSREQGSDGEADRL